MVRRPSASPPSRRRILAFAATAALCALLPASPARAATLQVGPGLRFERVEDAAAKADEGDAVLVHPRPGNLPYEPVAVLVARPRVALRAAVPPGGPRIPLSGKGFDHSGAGRVPRAIVQFGPGADGGTLQGFELFGAHNGSHNGAGVRVDRANGVSVLDCEIRGNDMGVMSNGDGTDRTSRDFLLERCTIHHNGDPADPGFNHNLYLGGTSATLRFCEVHSSLTGHNVKSRAHQTRLEWCWIHDSANREIDFVDAADTAAPDSHAVIAGCILAKASPCEGNREVIHFGQDGGKEHDGTLFLVHNTVVTPYVSAVVTLSAPKAKCRMLGNFVCDGGAGQRNQVAAAARAGAEARNVTGER
ncbi:MAG: hypothetical protein MUC63_07285, partial [Planctomycetes bacterium]|nr:hypothetical protein [Planctomycetota bacterium]